MSQTSTSSASEILSGIMQAHRVFSVPVALIAHYCSLNSPFSEKKNWKLSEGAMQCLFKKADSEKSEHFQERVGFVSIFKQRL